MTAPLVRYRGLIWNFAQRDLKARFKGTAMGWAWSLLLPLATLAVYTLAGHFIFRFHAPPFANGQAGNFAVWLFCGLTAWGIFANGINTAIGTLLASGHLIKKIYFPSYAPVLGSVGAVAVQSAIEVGLVLVVLVFFGNVGWTWLLVPLWIVTFFVFVTALSLILAIGNVYFRDLAHLVSVALQLLIYATPVIYPETAITNPTIHRVIMGNPLSQFIVLFRDLVYGLSTGELKSWLYVLAWTIAMTVGSVAVYCRYGLDLSEQV